jgi:hypothetical protein
LTADDITQKPANLLFKIHIYELIYKDENRGSDHIKWPPFRLK